jgi:hypothetical protein
MWLVDVEVDVGVEVVRCDPSHQSRPSPGLEVVLYNTAIPYYVVLSRPTATATWMYVHVRVHGPISNERSSATTVSATDLSVKSPTCAFGSGCHVLSQSIKLIERVCESFQSSHD